MGKVKMSNKELTPRKRKTPPPQPTATPEPEKVYVEVETPVYKEPEVSEKDIAKLQAAIIDTKRNHQSDLENLDKLIKKNSELIHQLQEKQQKLSNLLMKVPESDTEAHERLNKVEQVVDAQGHALVHVRDSQATQEPLYKTLKSEVNKLNKYNKYLMIGMGLTIIISLLI